MITSAEMHEQRCKKYMSLPQELRDMVCKAVIHQDDVGIRLDSVSPHTQYLSVSQQFSEDMAQAFRGSFIVVVDKTVLSIPHTNLNETLLSHPKARVMVQNVFIGEQFSSIVDFVTKMVVSRSLRQVEIVIAGTAASDAQLSAFASGDSLRGHCRTLVGENKKPSENGPAKFWTTKVGQKMLDFVALDLLRQVKLRVTASAHWVIFCPYHELVEEGCTKLKDHWSGGSVVRAVGIEKQHLDVRVDTLRLLR